MLRFLVFVWNLFGLLPWWGAVSVLATLAVGLVLLAKYFVHRLIRDSIHAVATQGAALTDALATVHTIEPTAAPTERSVLDGDPNDDDYDPDFDDDFIDESACHYWVDATIVPRQLDARWDPAALSLIDAEFAPQEELEISERMGVLHTIEVWRDGAFQAWSRGQVVGPQRLRMLFAAPPELRDARFAYHFTYFGRTTLPVPQTAAAAARPCNP